MFCPSVLLSGVLGALFRIAKLLWELGIKKERNRNYFNGLLLPTSLTPRGIRDYMGTGDLLRPGSDWG